MRRGHAARRLGLRAVLAALALASLSSCGITHIHDLNFRVDKRLSFTGPESRALIKQPITVSWTMKDFTVAAAGTAAPSRDAGYFAVFVDRTPVKPGQTLDAVAHGDRFCQQDPSCPDQAYLKSHQVFTTTATSLKLPRITDVVGDKESIQLHTITIVLMDTAGHRIGESAWQRDVRLRRISSYS